MSLLQSTGVYENTIIFYTTGWHSGVSKPPLSSRLSLPFLLLRPDKIGPSCLGIHCFVASARAPTDNGPHQGEERTDIHWSTNFLRQCKASIFEGGIRIPGMMHAPMLISSNLNVSTPATTADFLPTIMEVLGVQSSNPSWVMDGISLIPMLKNITAPRPKPLIFSWGGQSAVIDNEWKLMNKPNAGQCDYQEPYSSMKSYDEYYLFNLNDDYHELVQLKDTEPEQYARMLGLYNDMLASIANSKANETGCGKPSPPAPPAPPAPPSSTCQWYPNSGLNGSDIAMRTGVSSREECCGICVATHNCVAADLNGDKCHLKSTFDRIVRAGSTACVPPTTITEL